MSLCSKFITRRMQAESFFFSFSHISPLFSLRFILLLCMCVRIVYYVYVHGMPVSAHRDQERASDPQSQKTESCYPIWVLVSEFKYACPPSQLLSLLSYPSLASWCPPFPGSEYSSLESKQTGYSHSTVALLSCALTTFVICCHHHDLSAGLLSS